MIHSHMPILALAFSCYELQILMLTPFTCHRILYFTRIRVLMQMFYLDNGNEGDGCLLRKWNAHYSECIRRRCKESEGVRNFMPDLSCTMWGLGYVLIQSSSNAHVLNAFIVFLDFCTPILLNATKIALSVALLARRLGPTILWTNLIPR